MLQPITKAAPFGFLSLALINSKLEKQTYLRAKKDLSCLSFSSSTLRPPSLWCSGSDPFSFSETATDLQETQNAWSFGETLILISTNFSFEPFQE